MKTKTVFSDSHQGIPFEIHRRDRPTVWKFYIFLHEEKVLDFESLWLPPKVHPLFNYVTYNYSSLPVNQIYGWNGGISHYQKYGEVPNHRCVELGCDYQHPWDEGKEYTLYDIQRDVINTIDDLVPFLKS